MKSRTPTPMKTHQFAVCTVLGTTLFAQQRETVAPPLVTTCVDIVDVDRGDVRRNRIVVFQGDVIDSILTGDAAPPASATRIDGANGYPIPGRCDMQVRAAMRGGAATIG